MAEQDDKSAAMVKTGDQSSIGAACAPGEERDSAIGICAVHSHDQQSQRIVELEEQKNAQSATIATQAEALATMTERVT